MTSGLTLLHVLLIVGGIVAVIGAMLAPIYLIGQWILAPIDRAAKFRKAPVRFSIGDFLSLFLAIQIPLTAIYQFIEKEEERLFWLFTIITWLVAPVVWFACARTLSKAGVSNGRHRFVFIGLVMPAVYYGLVPFVLLTIVGVLTLLGLFPTRVINRPEQLAMSFQSMVAIWFVLGIIFFVSGLFTKRILREARADEYSISDATRELEMARAAMLGTVASDSLAKNTGDR